MLNPLVTIISGGKAVTHPFAGGVKKASITKKHRALIWGCMLGTVYAKDPTTDRNQEEKYFDYDYAAAHLHAKVAQCTDLRIYRPNKRYKYMLYGIPPNNS